MIENISPNSIKKWTNWQTLFVYTRLKMRSLKICSTCVAPKLTRYETRSKLSRKIKNICNLYRRWLYRPVIPLKSLTITNVFARYWKKKYGSCEWKLYWRIKRFRRWSCKYMTEMLFIRFVKNDYNNYRGHTVIKYFIIFQLLWILSIIIWTYFHKCIVLID